jgi:mRNA interferase MazF
LKCILFIKVLKLEKKGELEARLFYCDLALDIYTIYIYFCSIPIEARMKTISLKIDDNIFRETESILSKQFDICIADLKPRAGTEPGKTRPVLVVQSNMLNNANHPSSLVCPITTNVRNSSILRIHIEKGTSQLHQACDIMIDQIRAIDNKRLTKKIDSLPKELIPSPTLK